ncbi:ergot alkaloid biosynthesis protein [Amycolatopsis balhimycina DSM 5908]|uniref:Ergot alkaloid biosynthesis protein n=1 Tax=Amycolatopsis balhimycina DSM 5908 TaxID=1081091 RepID=A0A428WPC0_AMYBA|nr:NAD(P)H-binding protein [Amycolatopsis balhimycina]RSM44927.1 ergot alkaloid biosynthesis protein [Amycolatopsis balhimycina DSM 5908]
MTGVLVTGGTGKTGRELVNLLRDSGVPVRVASRNPAAGDPDAIRFDWNDPATHPAALNGHDRVFLVPPVQSVDPMPLVGPFLTEAQRLGVRKVVLLGSAIPLAPKALDLAGQVEAQPGGVVLRASGFMQNFVPPHPLGRRIRRDGEIRTAAGDGRVAWIDARDIAATAAALLSDLDAIPGDQHDYLLTGPQALSYPEAAAIITAVTGRPVRVVHAGADEQAADLRAAGIPAEFATILAAADAGVLAGREDELSTAVLALTGRPPRTFTQFVQEHAARWATPAA